MHVKKDDIVYILAGKDKGKTGKIVKVFPLEDKVIVDGINQKKVHQRSKREEGKGGMVEKEFPVHISNVKIANKETAKASDKKKSAEPKGKK